MSPQRIQRRRTKGWRMPEGAVYVGRPSRWGNPYVLGREGDVQRWTHWVVIDSSVPYEPTVGRFDTEREARVGAVDWFAMWLSDAPRLWIAQTELAGRDLACWCPLDQPCHADVLLKVANS